ncbi:MAG: hypothetical protein ABGW69_00850, partial [Nanoarchaeota archaeon]
MFFDKLFGRKKHHNEEVPVNDLNKIKKVIYQPPLDEKSINQDVSKDLPLNKSKTNNDLFSNNLSLSGLNKDLNNSSITVSNGNKPVDLFNKNNTIPIPTKNALESSAREINMADLSLQDNKMESVPSNTANLVDNKEKVQPKLGNNMLNLDLSDSLVHDRLNVQFDNHSILKDQTSSDVSRQVSKQTTVTDHDLQNNESQFTLQQQSQQVQLLKQKEEPIKDITKDVNATVLNVLNKEKED